MTLQALLSQITLGENISVRGSNSCRRIIKTPNAPVNGNDFSAYQTGEGVYKMVKLPEEASVIRGCWITSMD